MGIKDLLRKRKIGYVPGKAVLEPPPPVTEETFVTADEIVESVSDEIHNLIELRDAIISILPDYEIPLPEDVSTIFGKDTVTLREYVSYYPRNDYGVQMMRESVHEWTGSVENMRSDVTLAYQLVHPLDTMLDVLADDALMFAEAALDSDLAQPCAEAISRDIEESKRLREEALKTVAVAKENISLLMLIRAITEEDISELKTSLGEFIEILEKIKRVLAIAYTAYCVDWNSVVSYLASSVYEYEQRNRLIREVSVKMEAIEFLVRPLKHIVSKLFKGKKPIVKAVRTRIVAAIYKAVSKIVEEYLEDASVVAASCQTRAELALKEVCLTREALFCKRVALRLQALIDALRSLKEEDFNLEEIDRLALEQAEDILEQLWKDKVISKQLEAIKDKAPDEVIVEDVVELFSTEKDLSKEAIELITSTPTGKTAPVSSAKQQKLRQTAIEADMRQKLKDEIDLAKLEALARSVPGATEGFVERIMTSARKMKELGTFDEFNQAKILERGYLKGRL